MKFCNSKKNIVLTNSVIFAIAFNAPMLIQHYNNYKLQGSIVIYAILFEFICTSLSLFPVIYIGVHKNKLARLLLFIVYAISGIAAYFIYQLHIVIDKEIIAAFFEANQNEIYTFISLSFVFTILASILLAALCIFSIDQSKIELEQDTKLNFISLVFFISCLLGDSDSIGNALPYSLFKNTGIYFLEKTSLLKKRINIAEAYDYSIENVNNLNIILIIGESARGDHFSLGGRYARETNPLLKQELDNIVYYKKVTACYPLTRIAVPCMITRATRDHRKLSSEETSFIGIFKKLGFHTMWIGMQGTYSVIDAPYLDLAKESDKTLLLGTDVEIFKGDDSALLPLVDQFLQNHPEGNNLLILHTYGSHFHYEDRYADQFREFHPICKKKSFLSDMSHCSISERINSYDNSIIYTDFFIKNIIDKLKNKKALIIYTSDHGESLGERGRFLHGTHNADEQIDVSMLFWFSDAYQQSYPENVKNLHRNKQSSISHDHLFHSILACNGVKSKIIEDKLNLCAKKP
jgi:glucan phosphoethanolaminetransferase (alkaline phosphatase superfamily)